MLKLEINGLGEGGRQPGALPPEGERRELAFESGGEQLSRVGEV